MCGVWGACVCVVCVGVCAMCAHDVVCVGVRTMWYVFGVCGCGVFVWVCVWCGMFVWVCVWFGMFVWIHSVVCVCECGHVWRRGVVSD